MRLTSKYIDITINNNTFYIVKSSSKPQNSDALIVLAKIEFIVKNKLLYNTTHYNIHADQSQANIYEILGKLSSQIQKRYENKERYVNCLARATFSKKNQISRIDTRIQNYIKPPKVLPLPNELIHEITKYLTVSDIGSLARLNRHGKAHAEIAIIRRAREFGFEGRIFHAQASKYIENLFKEVNELARKKIIPAKYHTCKKKKFNSEKILQNLQDLTTEDAFSILRNKELYLPFFSRFKNIFNQHRKWKVTKTDSDEVRQQGIAALILAAQNHNKSILKLLLEHGAKLNIPAENGSYPLHFAAQSGDTECVQLLLKHGAEVNEKSGSRNTALAFACGYGDISYHSPNQKVVELLLQHGANPNIPTSNGISPLLYAAHFAYDNIVELLLRYGAKARIRDRHNVRQRGSPYVLLAVKNGDMNILKLLLRLGASPNIPAKNGNCPLHFAAQSGDADSVELLLKYGARVNVEGGGNDTALALACGSGDKTHHNPNPKVVELLLQYGANPNIATCDGSTPLKLAQKYHFLEIVSLLINHNAKP